MDISALVIFHQRNEMRLTIIIRRRTPTGSLSQGANLLPMNDVVQVCRNEL
jgi:hypothetical protein